LGNQVIREKRAENREQGEEDREQGEENRKQRIRQTGIRDRRRHFGRIGADLC
jgi:hypothetical protein